MVKVLSTIHHGLRLPALGVKFRDGVAEVDEELVPKVLNFAHLGVTLAEPEPEPDADDLDESEDSDEDSEDDDADEVEDSDEADEDDDADEVEESDEGDADEAEDAEDADNSDEDEAITARPRRNASRENWAKYAEVLGVPVGTGATRDEIRALFD